MCAATFYDTTLDQSVKFQSLKNKISMDDFVSKHSMQYTQRQCQIKFYTRKFTATNAVSLQVIEQLSYIAALNDQW